jgi:hypothetical protein
VTAWGALLAAIAVVSLPTFAQAPGALPSEALPTGAEAPTASTVETAGLGSASGSAAVAADQAPAVAVDGAGSTGQPGPTDQAPLGDPAVTPSGGADVCAPDGSGDCAAVDLSESPVAPKAGGPEDPLFQRLLGGGPVEPAPVVAPAVGFGFESPTIPSWLWVVGILGGGALLLLRSRSMRALRGPDAISVVSRTQLGKDGNLAVVEVIEADGERRRLLVGFGSGAPRLVADLGRPMPEAEAAEASQPVASAAVQRVAPPPPANAASAWAKAVRGAETPDARRVPGPLVGGRPSALEHRHDLIKEVLAERTDDDPSDPSARGMLG